MATKTQNLGLTRPDPEDFYDINIENENMDIIDKHIKVLYDQISDDTIIEPIFRQIFTKLPDGEEADPTAMTSEDIEEAISREWNGEESPDPTAMTSEDIEEAISREWNGEESPDETAMTLKDIEEVTG